MRTDSQVTSVRGAFLQIFAARLSRAIIAVRMSAKWQSRLVQFRYQWSNALQNKNAPWTGAKGAFYSVDVGVFCPPREWAVFN